MAEPPCAVYITSPDYLGGVQDIAALAEAAHEFGVPLLVDNAHGAYLAFLGESAHPVALGADMCCDSAHKTLGVLTGGAYLHVSRASRFDFGQDAREALAVMGSSSPSYLIMQSLDAMNLRLAGAYRAELADCVSRLDGLKSALSALGVPVAASDPLRLTIAAHEAGKTGFELAEALRLHGAEPEFADRDCLVMMFTPDVDERAYGLVADAFCGFEPGAPRPALPLPAPGERVLTPREALLAPRERIAAAQAEGRVMASAAVTCPPAIPVAVLGERLTRAHVQLLSQLGVEYVDVVVTN